ncbi:hypothetical protein CF319_g9434 [Tilletia indica]|nr:hypothetical protein CF319_g9434 [Tilletia indica]KAE8215456.1 hypothetical protein CF326_g9729 [Tilletia indica]
MTSSRTPPPTSTKRGRGRPKGSRNKPKHAVSSPRRNARRTSTHAPLQNHGDNEWIDMRPDDWTHVFQFVEQVKMMVSPHIHKWPKNGRFRVAGALNRMAHLCTTLETDEV